jgi:hypothetical protein
VSKVDSASVVREALQDQLQMQLAQQKAREKIAKRAKGGVNSQPLNVPAADDHLSRRHNTQRYM